MDEWDLQKYLTELWSCRGLKFQDERLFLAAWEVMSDDWGINDSKRDWHQPSIDFVFCDRRGSIWLMEIKNEASTPRSILSLICQVTHRAVSVHDNYSYERLALAFMETRSGIHGRNCGGIKDDFRRSHQAFFRLRRPLPKDRFNGSEIRRIISAREFNGSFYPILRSFNHDARGFRRRLIRDYSWRSALEFKRFCKLPEEKLYSLERPVLYLNLGKELAECERRGIC